MKWYPCELHCHTIHSDGGFSVPELLETARSRELCGICLTDHNTPSGWQETEGSTEPFVLRGIEWTTYHGHMLVLDCDRYVDWRDAVPDNIDTKIQQVKENYGLVGIAHPFQLGTPICTGGHWDFKVENWNNIDYIEIFSEGSPYVNPANLRAREMWHSLLSRGFRIAPTMGRDWHRKRANTFISACTYLLCDDSFSDAEMKKAINGGRTVVSAGPLFYFETEGGETMGDTVAAGEHTFCFSCDISRHERLESEREVIPEKILIVSAEGEREYPFCDRIKIDLKENSWYSAELWGRTDGKEDMLLCLTAPIYTKRR